MRLFKPFQKPSAIKSEDDLHQKMKATITELTLEHVIFGTRWFAWLDRWIEQNYQARAKIGQRIVEIVLIAVVAVLCILRVLDIERLTGAGREC